MYKKRGRHDIEAKSTNNEEKFASQFFNFLRKHLELVISQVSVPQINLEVSTATPQVVPALSSAGSVPVTKCTQWMTSMNPPLTHYSMLKVGR
jgi:hypothetical protein